MYYFCIKSGILIFVLLILIYFSSGFDVQILMDVLCINNNDFPVDEVSDPECKKDISKPWTCVKLIFPDYFGMENLTLRKMAILKLENKRSNFKIWSDWHCSLPLFSLLPLVLPWMPTLYVCSIIRYLPNFVYQIWKLYCQITWMYCNFLNNLCKIRFITHPAFVLISISPRYVM